MAKGKRREGLVGELVLLGLCVFFAVGAFLEGRGEREQSDGREGSNPGASQSVMVAVAVHPGN